MSAGSSGKTQKLIDILHNIVDNNENGIVVDQFDVEKFAAAMEKYDPVGYDIVNHCINDISVPGAEPVYFLD